MVCHLTIGKKKYADVEPEMKAVLAKSEDLRAVITRLIDRDTDAFNKVMEAFGLPKENDDQKALRSDAIQEATKEATMIPLEVMKHCIDGMALAKIVAEKGNQNSLSDAGVSALLFHAACEGAALNVRINLGGIKDTEFVGWKSEEVVSILRTSTLVRDEIMSRINTALQPA
jgi:formiminotetrahydrofolate cyclodeaminase